MFWGIRCDILIPLGIIASVMMKTVLTRLAMDLLLAVIAVVIMVMPVEVETRMTMTMTITIRILMGFQGHPNVIPVN